MIALKAMSTPAPLISVIVVCKNPGPPLRTALASVREQRGASVEIVVVDGASADGTREWLESQAAPDLHVVSEPDCGVYDAMNKGLAAARGSWLLFLGADDRLAGPKILASASVQLRTSEAEIVVGEARFDDGRTYPLAAVGTAVQRNFVHHQAAFYRKDSMVRRGGFDPSLRVMADYDLNTRLLTTGARFEAMTLHVAECASGGLSDAGSWAGYREEITVRHRYFPFKECWWWDLGSVARWIRKQGIRLRRAAAPSR